jgi:hypothetical protein
MYLFIYLSILFLSGRGKKGRGSRADAKWEFEI